MRKDLFIAIGVHQPKFLDQLPGVIESIDLMTEWASNSYEVVVIDDREKPVIVDRIRSKLTPEDETGDINPSLLLDRNRIFIYFCGHGIAAWPDQYWILSPGPNQSRHRISSNALRDTLATYQVIPTTGE